MNSKLNNQHLVFFSETEDDKFTDQQKDLLRETWKGIWNKDVKVKFAVTLFKK